MDFPFLLLILLLPLTAAIGLCFTAPDQRQTIRTVAGGSMLLSLLLTVMVFAGYDVAAGGMQYALSIPWITDLGVSFALGVDGISAPLLLMAEAVGTAAVFTSWEEEKRPKEYFILLLLFVAGVAGVFIAQDLFFFLIFCEGVVVPIYILILVWGSTQRFTKEYAGLKLTMFLLLSSAFMLVGMVAIYLQAYPAGARTFSIQALQTAAAAGAFSEDFQIFTFFLLLLGFGSLTSMVPLHNWSPDGHAGAPAAVSMVHAGVLKKIGAYGLIRIGLLVLPVGAKFWAPYIAGLAMINVVYAAYIALIQKDLKYIIGYSSVSHMGYILLGFAGMNVISISGAVANMVAHGVMSALFFALIGYVYERTHLRTVPELSGLVHLVPNVTIGLVLAGLASSGLPGLIGFIPEYTIFMGIIGVYPYIAVPAIAGVIFTALYVLRMLAKLLFGPKSERPEVLALQDASGANLLPVLILGSIMVIFGIFPGLLMEVIRSGLAPVEPLLNALNAMQIGGGLL